MTAGSALVLTVASYSACVALTYVLTWRFRRRGASTLPALLAAAALTFGLLVLVSGVLHTLAVINLKITNRAPYDLRFVFLLTTGLILIHVGLAQIVLSRWIVRGTRWPAGVSAAATLQLLAFIAVLSPVNSAASSLLIAFGAYVALSAVQLITSRHPGLEAR
jgi:hypothetical protein